MTIQKLMSNKIFLTLFIIAVQAQDDHDDHEMTTAQAWGFATLAGVGIFLIGLLAALLVIGLRKCISSNAFKILRNMLNGIGCGAVIGDSVVHLLPEAYSNPEVNSNIVALIFIIAIASFILLERIFTSCGITHDHDKDLESCED